MANATRYTRIDPSGEAETQLRKITEQASWLKKVIPSMGSFTCLILIGFSLRDHVLRTLGIILLKITMAVPLMCWVCVYKNSLDYRNRIAVEEVDPS